MHFVDDEDAVLPGRGGVAHALADLAHVVDAGVAGGVDLLHVEGGAGGDLEARRALSARLLGRALVAVQRARQDARDRGLGDAARPGEQERVRHASEPQRVAQRGHHVPLTLDLVEGLRPEAARENLVAHVSRIMSGENLDRVHHRG